MPTSTVSSNTTDTAGIRLRGVPELSSGDALQRELDDLEEVRKVLFHLNVNCTVTGLKRFGRRGTSKPGNCRTLIVNVSNQEDKRIILLSARKMTEYDKRIFLDRELTKEELAVEKAALKKCREMIEEGAEPRNLRIRNVKLQKKLAKIGQLYQTKPTD